MARVKTNLHSFSQENALAGELKSNDGEWKPEIGRAVSRALMYEFGLKT